MLISRENPIAAWFFSLSLIPMLLVFLAFFALVTGIMLFIFFKAPVRKGGVFGGLESIEDPEEREAMRRYVFGLDEERPLIGKEKQKAEAKAAKAMAEGADEAAEPAAVEKSSAVGIMDAEFEVVSDEEAEAVIAEEIGEVAEEAVEETADSEETV